MARRAKPQPDVDRLLDVRFSAPARGDVLDALAALLIDRDEKQQARKRTPPSQAGESMDKEKGGVGVVSPRRQV